jgi:hypothetical protein
VTNTQVGKRWDVALADVGYMLASPAEWGAEFAYQRRRTQIEPERFSTGETPFTGAIDRYSFLDFSSAIGGAGQKYLNRSDSDQTSFWDSSGVDPFTEDRRLTLLPKLNQVSSSAHTSVVLAGGRTRLLHANGTASVRATTLSGDTPTTEQTYAMSPGGGLTAVYDMDMNDQYCYVAMGLALDRITLGTSTVTQGWSALDVGRVEWIGDRLAVIYRDAPTNTYRFSTLSDAGVEEVAGGLFTWPGATAGLLGLATTLLGGITSGGGYVWFSSFSANEDGGFVFVWPMDTTLSASIALKMPAGDIPADVFYYQGQVFIWAQRIATDRAVVYRCAVNGDGTLTPFLLVPDAGTAGASGINVGRKFAARGDKVFFCWNDMESNLSGIGTIDLSTGGYAKRSLAGASGDVRGVAVWGNRPVFGAVSRDLYFEDSNEYLTTGWLRTSIMDGDSALAKRWDQVSVVAGIGASQDVDVAYSTDDGATYTDVPLTFSGGVAEADLALMARSLGLQVTLDGPGTTTPSFNVVSTRFHPVGIQDELLVVPIDCSDSPRDLQGQPTGASNDGEDRLAALEALLGTTVSFQDVDWHLTGVEKTCEVLQVAVVRKRIGDRQDVRARSRAAALVTLRRQL